MLLALLSCPPADPCYSARAASLLLQLTHKLSNWAVAQLVRAAANLWPQDSAARAAVLQRAAHASFILG